MTKWTLALLFLPISVFASPIYEPYHPSDDCKESLATKESIPTPLIAEFQKNVIEKVSAPYGKDSLNVGYLPSLDAASVDEVVEMLSQLLNAFKTDILKSVASGGSYQSRYYQTFADISGRLFVDLDAKSGFATPNEKGAMIRIAGDYLSFAHDHLPGPYEETEHRSGLVNRPRGMWPFRVTSTEREGWDVVVKHDFKAQVSARAALILDKIRRLEEENRKRPQ